ncbi:hypothetical protein LTR10_019868 [Elasticomyces elasticus]|uniref:Uncharacterized protein n=1 Tax=Exophiala sideris TaxID=1016849 RepID=A0ABR0IY17_9EURO|nr:hypothetical protein LTR10_019868 [Elasticomyces elasticus]KAK5022408.1 hypothetical protein LTS07_010068 [Exophiala sideris]KAK5027234.1 hypothetical protein LTR13_009629 [Exophiala sideris]KAK5051262.1 hypothetical protein LTR69_010288 [Exophiala sideris]KAK5177774.1 hypothetical protein LTR44_009749 [Eurotiomycetes sp. CCFEE 6388]
MAVAVPANEAAVVHNLNTRDAILSFNTFTAAGCNNADFYDTHSPITPGICHAFAGNERSLDVYFQSGLCQLYLYNDNDCNRGAAIIATQLTCYPGQDEYNSYKVLC